ncbi:hypothetical protein [Halonotius roseus]|uniref:hypothetical protein n=1 Tax=Halonotius roseus TaxID=2511997 RepID=UPI00163D2985|nr:hypothetical protein [Halonotius roseus]
MAAKPPRYRRPASPAARSANPDDASTAGTNVVSDEERSESREFCEPGGIYDPAGSRP